MPIGAAHVLSVPGLHRKPYREIAAMALFLGLSACASDHPYNPAPVVHDALGSLPRPTPNPSPGALTSSTDTSPGQIVKVSDLNGWSTEDHFAAFLAFRAGCKVVKDAALHGVCVAADTSRINDDTEARLFFERRFRVETLPGEGVLTGYFAPVYPARMTRDLEYSAPVRPPPPPSRLVRLPPTPELDPLSLAKAVDRPISSVVEPSATPSLPSVQSDANSKTANDLIGSLLDPDAPAAKDTSSQLIADRNAQRMPLREAERALIDLTSSEDALAWMRPEDLFFLQIQGSGVLVFPDGSRRRAAYAGDNGKPFVGIARVMVRDGLLPQNGASGDAIRHWLSAHAGFEADQVMRKNPRYVFFRISEDAGGEPLGAAGVPLPPGRAIAMDSTHHTFGAPYWIDAEAPSLAGAAPRYHRLAVALDTGGAIRGPIRADLYFGTGDAAGREAGRVKHVLRLARLVPIDPDLSETVDASTARSGRR